MSAGVAWGKSSRSFSNGNQGPPRDSMADWYAGWTDQQILSHWWCR